MSYMPDPPKINWELLFAMNGLKKGCGYGIVWCNFDAGKQIVIRHSHGKHDSQIFNSGIIALLEYLGV